MTILRQGKLLYAVEEVRSEDGDTMQRQLQRRIAVISSNINCERQHDRMQCQDSILQL